MPERCFEFLPESVPVIQYGVAVLWSTIYECLLQHMYCLGILGILPTFRLSTISLFRP